MYVPWDEAGCLCPVGDLFNYAAPEGESLDVMDVSSFSPHVSLNGDMTTDELHEEKRDTPWALTDGGFEENVSAYCFYARESYKKGEQVFWCHLIFRTRMKSGVDVKYINWKFNISIIEFDFLLGRRLKFTLAFLICSLMHSCQSAP